jgi:release factor glutamine methyltransferase
LLRILRSLRKIRNSSLFRDLRVDLLSSTPRADALRTLRRAFELAGLDTPGLDARLLLLAGLQIEPTDLVTRPEAPLGEPGAARLGGFAARRLAGEPVSRILGRREFWGLDFDLSPDTLVPRPDSETVVETALSLLPPGPARVLDLGTGSGCLLVALLHERPQAWGLGIDRSSGALATAWGNAWRNGVGARVALLAADWVAPLAGRFDLVISNPPYIASPVIPTLDREVREHDPALALDGGADGLDAYRTIVAEAPRLLGPGGHLVLEIGYDQAEAVRGLGTGSGLEFRHLAHDLTGNPRCLAFRAPAGPVVLSDPAFKGP